MEIHNDNLTIQPSTKRERWLLKKQQKERQRMLLQRCKKIKKLLFISLPILLLAGMIVFFAKNYTPEENHPGAPKIEILTNEYDAGTVSMADGVVKHTYEIKNTGVGDLKIDSIWTSCHCTAAILKVENKESPKFGMNNNPIFWSQKIAPNQTGQLEVIFDPAFHGPQGTGQAVRIVYLSTNDPENKKAEVRLLANVIQ